MKHDHASAALATRTILERCSRIATTWPEYHDGEPKADAHLAYQIAKEQLHGPQARVSQEEAVRIGAALEVAIPELFAEYWQALPLPREGVA